MIKFDKGVTGRIEGATQPRKHSKELKLKKGDVVIIKGD